MSEVHFAKRYYRTDTRIVFSVQQYGSTTLNLRHELGRCPPAPIKGLLQIRYASSSHLIYTVSSGAHLIFNVFCYTVLRQAPTVVTTGQVTQCCARLSAEEAVNRFVSPA